MPRHARILADSGVYHVMLRGVNRDALFIENGDYARFLHALSLTKELSGCAVLAYCLMPNHAHLVLRVGDEPLSSVMKRLGVRYVGWFNRKYKRVGHLFQDRFKSKPVETDDYLGTVLRYVWKNPVAAGLVATPEDYPWSSHSLTSGSELVDVDVLATLVPEEILNEKDLGPSVQPVTETRQTGRLVNTEARDLLRARYGVAQPEDFVRLSLSVQRRAIAELRTRSISYARIALATGLTKFQVKHIQATSAAVQ